jgi:hypothetical protein
MSHWSISTTGWGDPNTAHELTATGAPPAIR